MTMRARLQRLIAALVADDRGAGAAEFAMVLPILMMVTLGTVDAGRFLWEWNRLEKATQAGARMAVVTDLLAPGIATKNFVGVTVNGVKLTQGDRIPAGAMADVVCTSSGCTSSDSGFTGNLPAGAMDRLVLRMQTFRRDINASNVTVTYRGSNLGFAGNPSGSDISPLVTVKVSGLNFRPIAGFLFFNMQLPDRATTLSAEDLSGSQSN